jgi:hypothetical protein
LIWTAYEIGIIVICYKPKLNFANNFWQIVKHWSSRDLYSNSKLAFLNKLFTVCFRSYLNFYACFIPTGEHSGCIQLAVCPVIAFMDRGSWNDSPSTTSATATVPSCAGNVSQDR